MKKYLSLLPFLILSFASFAQYGWAPQNLGGPKTYVHVRGLSGSDSAFVYSTSFADTSSANLGLIKDVPGATIRTVNTLWIRDNTAQYWIEFGSGSLFVDTTNSVLLRGDGSPPNPLAADIRVSSNPGNQIVVLPNGVYSSNASQIQNGLISGGLVIWEVGLTYTVTAATYAIGGVIYTSPETLVTLDNADPTDSRFDGFIVTTSSTATNLTGTPSTDPVNPSYDATTELPLTFVSVAAASTEPTYCRDSIYFPNNAQNWTASVSNVGRINTTSTSNPYSVTQDVEFTLAINGDQLRFDKGSTVTLSTYGVVAVKLRSKATWAATSYITAQFYNTLTPLGVPVAIGDNTPYGFNSSNTAGYQTAAVPVGNFGVTTGANAVVIRVVTTGSNTIGFHLDDLQLLGCDGTPIPTSGSFWSVTGNLQRTTLFGGTRDNFPVQMLANNLNHTRLLQSGSTWMQGTNPGISFRLGNFASADYFIQQTGTAIITNTAGSFANRVSGSNIYTYNPTDGHTWYSSGGTGQVRLDTNFIIGGLTGNLSTIFNVISTTRASHPFPTMTTAQKNAIATPQEGDLVYDDDLDTYYYYDAAWLPLGAIYTANNGLTMTANNAQLGGDLTVNGTTTITGGAATNEKLVFTGGPSSGTWVQVVSSNSSNAFEGTSTGNGTGVLGSTTGSGSGVGGYSPNGTGVSASSDAGKALTMSVASATTNAVVSIGDVIANTTGTAANGFGGSIDFYVETNPFNGRISNRIITKWSDATDATRTSQFIVSGINSSATNEILTLNGVGSVMLNDYGIGTFTGTAAYTLQVDASGNIIEGIVSGGVYTASNGLTMTANDVVFGGTLTGVTTINTGGFGTVWTGSNTTDMFTMTNTSSGKGLVVSSSSNYGLEAYSTTGVGASIEVIPTTVNTLVPVLDVKRFTSSSAATVTAGIGGSIDMYVNTTVNAKIASRIASTWTDPTDATRTGDLQLWTTNSAVSAVKATLAGSGAFRLHNYGINTFAGVAAYVLGVDASGNLVEVAAAGAGMTNVLTTTGDIIYSSSGTTPARLGIGTSGQVLQVSAGGIPEWVTPGVGGSVTSVAQSFTGGLISVAGSPITTSGTLALTVAGTSGGGVYFSSTSTWASTGLLAANAIMIGGGAGAAYSTTTTGTGVLTALGINVGNAGAFVTFNGPLGTPSSGTLTNATGLPISSGVSGLGTGVATALAVNTGSAGAIVLFNGALGTPSSATLTSATGLPLTTGVTGTLDETNGGTGLTSYTTGDITYASASNTLSRLAAGTNGFVLTLAAGVPTWAAAGSGTVTSITLTQPSAGITITNSGVAITGSGTRTFALSDDLAGVEALATTGIVRRTGTSTWTAGTLVSLTTEVTGTLPVANGGTGQTSYTNGQLLIGNGTTLTKATITGTANQINVTNGSGSITLAMAFNPTEQTLTDGATTTWNVTNGGNAVWTNNGTGRTLTLSNLVAGYTYTARLIQGAGGSKTVTTWTNVRWSNGTAPTLSTTAGATDMVSFYCVNSTYLIGTFVANVQ